MTNTDLLILAQSLQYEVDRRALVARRLLLEAENARLRGIPDALPPPTFRRIQRPLTAADIATMRELRARKISCLRIAHQLHISDQTVRMYTRDVATADRTRDERR